MNFNLPPNADKETVFAETEAYLGRLSLDVAEIDNQRPWGGFFVIDPTSINHFIETYFPELEREAIYQFGTELRPKILLVGPNEKLSWQYHNRRAELWKTIIGPVGFMKSKDDMPPALYQTLKAGELIQHDNQIRHRLIGLDDWGVVAEIWQHTVPDNPSGEADIIRLEDIYNRASL